METKDFIISKGEVADFREERIKQALADTAAWLREYTISHGMLRDEEQHVLATLLEKA